MNPHTLISRCLAVGALTLCLAAVAQQPVGATSPPAGGIPGPVAGNPLDVVPEKMPFNVPYGPPISAQRAQTAIQAAIGEAARRGWPMNVTVVDSASNLVAFVRMDGAQIGSIAVSEHKARTAAKFRRATRVFEDNLQTKDYKYILSLDDAIAVRGGIPLIEDGKLIGAIGCSGATGSQDEVVCTAGAATINK